MSPIFWADQHISATNRSKKKEEKKQDNIRQLVVVLDQFSPLSVHIYMLRQEDLSFPGKLLVSVL